MVLLDHLTWLYYRIDIAIITNKKKIKLIYLSVKGVKFFTY